MDGKREEICRIIGENISFIRKMVFSGPRESESLRVEAKPILIKAEKFFCFESFRADNKAVQKNIAFSDVPLYVSNLAVADFKQTNIITSGGDCTILVSKKGKITVINKIKNGVTVEPAAHNREKKYIIDAGENAAFLSALGVCDESGSVFDKKRAKFRQINRFIELLDDVYDSLPKDGKLTVCDLCSGKSYLTFAVYHYLTAIKSRSVEMYGVDLKADVIDYCEKLSQKLGFDGLHFLCADIGAFKTERAPDLVVSLHACDTATDVVLAYAINNNAGTVLSTPCCHHELFHTMKSPELSFIEKHSILKQKLADAATDSLRALLLEANGYSVEALELIDPEETPKNVMLRAVKSKKIQPGKREAAMRDYQNAVKLLGAEPSLRKMLRG